MASVSAYTNEGGYSSHRRQNGEGNPWEFSTPADVENDSLNSHPFGLNQDTSQKLQFNPPVHPRTPDQTHHAHSNGVSQGQSKPDEHFDPSYLSPSRGLRPGLNGSRSGSEADSLLDLYGHPRSLGERSAANSMDKERGISHEESYLDDEDPERSEWIHRDKLAVIESHEMQEAGIQLPPQQIRSPSKLKTRREHSHEVPDLPSQETELAPRIDRKKRRMRSPVRQEQEDFGEETLVNDFDLRTPEEIASDSYMESFSNVYRQPDLRKSSSRIPLPRSSPMPIPQEHIERDTPLPRKRGVSGNWTGEENGISYNRARSRGNSVGSQVLLDDPELAYNTPTPTSRPATRDSPTKSRIPSTKPEHTRKPSLTNTPPTPQPKPRNPSTTTTTPTLTPRTPSSTYRPKSRSGLDPRPPTAVNRPSGDAPWLATMYKPDPRLPPDQQLLPTHAKRLQQEQWDRAQRDSEQRRREDKASPQLPREFSPLAEHTVNGLQPSSSREADEKALGEEGGGEWPLVVPRPDTAQKPGNGNPTQPQPPPQMQDANQHAGYSPIPRLKQSESPVNSQLGNPNQRVLDPFEKEKGGRAGEDKKEKGCGCCVVM